MTAQLSLRFTKSSAKNAIAIEALARLAEQLARAAREDGIIFADVRVEALRRRIFKKANPKNRSLSYGPAVMQAAGLVRTTRTRRIDPVKHPELEHSHGNRQTVWLHPEVA